MKKYRIGENGKLIFLGYTEDEARESKAGRIEISERGEIIAIESGVGATKAELEAARTSLAKEGREALRVAFKRLHPEYTDRQLRIAVGDSETSSDEWLKTHPGR